MKIKLEEYSPTSGSSSTKAGKVDYPGEIPVTC